MRVGSPPTTLGPRSRMSSRAPSDAGLDDELYRPGRRRPSPDDDYPSYAERLAGDPGRQRRPGHLICGSASAPRRREQAARHPLAVCHDTYSAHQGVEHDDMNVPTLALARRHRAASSARWPSWGESSRGSRATSAASARSSPWSPRPGPSDRFLPRQ